MSQLWHARLGHLNYRKLQDMVRMDMVRRLTKNSACEGVCEGCVLGKHHRDPCDLGKAWRANHPLQLIHSDLCELRYPSLLGARYLLTFIDDYSRRVWVYFLERKKEVFEVFQKFKALVENQSGKIIKCLRIDNGGEYCNYAFESFC